MICNQCNEEKDENEFYLYRNGTHRKTTCKECEKERAKAWQKQNSEIVNKRRMERYYKQKEKNVL